MTIAPNAVVVALHKSEKKGAPLTSVDAHVELELRAGQGVVGDRRFSLSTKPKNQLTLVEEEAIAAALSAAKLDLPLNVTRRNVVTRGVALNHLVGKEFVVGDVVVRGIELCEPCGHLAKLSCDALRAALVHRGGLRAEIVSSGVVRVGSTIRLP